MKHFFFFLLCFAALLMSGCSSKSETPTEAPAEPAENTAPVRTLSIGISQDLDQSLDPHVSTSAGKREIFFNVFEGLVKPDAEGVMQPALAESFEIGANGDEFTFHLRSNVKFHNGKTLTAEDVVYSINRCRGAESGEPLVAALATITEVESPDENTVILRTAAPNLELLSYLNTAIIPCDYDGQDTAPVGTGPFAFDSHAVQESITLKRFADYWGKAPEVETAIFRVIETPEAMLMALRSGSIDMSVHRIISETAGLDDNFDIVPSPSNMVQALYLNHEFKPLSNLKVRQALNYALDIETLKTLVSDGMGEHVGSSMYPAFGKYYLPELSEAYTYDPEKAKALLAEAGYEDGFDLTITVPSNYIFHVDTAQVLADQLNAVGVRAKINLVEWATWLSEVYQGRQFEATVMGFDASALTARAMLERWVSDSSKNMINFSNAEYDQVMADAQVCSDEAQQTELYHRAETILSEEAANVYLVDPTELTVFRKGLSGYAFYPMFVIDLSSIHFED